MTTKNARMTRREELGMTQPQAAAKAKVSMATYRRWEINPDDVGQASRRKCEAVLNQRPVMRPDDAELAEYIRRLEEVWGASDRLTPRQASGIISSLDLWPDMSIRGWLENPAAEPLHTIEPFNYLDLRVMVQVADNRAWAQLAADRCSAVAREIEAGILPFDRPGCFFDEVLISLAVIQAQDISHDMPELLDDIMARPVCTDAEAEAAELEGRPEPLGDDDWDRVVLALDDAALWPDWELPSIDGHQRLPRLLARRHPFTWFDAPNPDGEERFDVNEIRETPMVSNN
jgi:transcriptional regulator with XRE-family HTH domain